jgi:hypothetical protein
MSKKSIRRGFIMSAMFWAFAAMAQQSNVALPAVASAAVPLYPPLARVANVQGVVHVKVTTDGHRVIATRVEDGNKLLASAADENARTWQFSTHEPTTFTVTYNYKLEAELRGSPNNPTVVLRLPTEVEVASRPMPPLDAGSASAIPTTH